MRREAAAFGGRLGERTALQELYLRSYSPVSIHRLPCLPTTSTFPLPEHHGCLRVLGLFTALLVARLYLYLQRRCLLRK